MPPRIKKPKEDKLTGELRRSQILTSYGSGALADFPRFSGIMAGLDEWRVINLPEAAKIHEKNLEAMLGKEYFYQVSSPDTDLKKTFALPAFRFPSWYYCPECHKLDRYTKISKPTTGNTSEYNSDLFCNECSDSKHKVKLIPSRFVVACLNGHIDDFPYVWWTHRNRREGACERPKLRLEYKGTTGGLDSIRIYCETCGAETTMSGCMDKEALKGLKCYGTQPWLGFGDDGKWYKDPVDCNATLRVLQRSANNVYYSVNKSALTIPPWSEKLHAIFQQRNSLFEDIFDDEEDEIPRRLKKQFQKSPELYGNNLDAFISAAYQFYREKPEDVSEKSLRCDEYDAFCNADTDDEYFRTESVEIPDFLSKYISQIKLVKKLREVMVLQGFRRILPATESDPDERKKLGINNEFSQLSRTPLDWLPAIELYGEGIFIQLDEEAVSAWEKKNLNRYDTMNDRLDVPWIGNGMFDKFHSRYVLLHTLAHLLIRQLSSQCGYATASIKEKLYSSFTDDSKKISGILIYTSATDTDGSLGGLVREGYTDRLGNTFENLLQEASWCSNDPLCIESTTQGYKGLNYAACYACTLLPETSCEAMNCLLDRAAIVGTPDNKEIAYFCDLL